MFTEIGNLSPLMKLAADARIIGIDTGAKNIGIALSDTRRKTASPLIQIRHIRLAETMKIIRSLAKEHDAAGFVIGIPLLMNGKIGARAQSAKDFARNLHQATKLPCALWDERLSSAAVSRTLRETKTPLRAKQQKQHALAATYILQNALNRLSNLATENQIP